VFGVALSQFGFQVEKLLFLVVVGGEKVVVPLMEIFELLFEAFDVTFFALAEGALRGSVLCSTPLHERWLVFNVSGPFQARRTKLPSNKTSLAPL
jgi:hypothetical protein